MTTTTLHTHHQIHFPTGMVALLILLLVGGAIVFAIVQGLSTTGRAVVEVPYAPYVAGPVIHTEPYAPYTAGPVVDDRAYAPYAAGPVIHESDLAK